MKAVTSDRLGLGTGRQAPALSSLHMCQLGPSWEAASSSTIKYLAPLPCPPPPHLVSSRPPLTAVGRGQYPQGQGPFGCAVCTPERDGGGGLVFTS